MKYEKENFNTYLLRKFNSYFFKLPKKKWAGPEHFTEFYPKIKELTPILYNFFQKIREYFQIHFIKLVLLIPNPNKDIQKTKLQSIFLMNINAKILKILANRIQQSFKKKLFTMTKCGLFQGWRLVQYLKSM